MRRKRISRESMIELERDARIAVDAIEKVSESEVSGLEDEVCKLYVEIQNVAEIAKQLNDSEQRFKGNKFIGKTVSGVIKGNSKTFVGKVANIIFSYNNTLQNRSMSFGRLIKELGEVMEDEDLSDTRH